jgi:hypothetical protein
MGVAVKATAPTAIPTIVVVASGVFTCGAEVPLGAGVVVADKSVLVVWGRPLGRHTS